MGERSLADLDSEFVFGRADAALLAELKEFWLKHDDAYHAELLACRPLPQEKESSQRTAQRAIRRQPGAIVREADGTIVGVVFVLLRELDPDLELGSHAYFLRIYSSLKGRTVKRASQLFKTFLIGFDAAAEFRDHRAKVLLAQNVNVRLHTAYVRKYLVRQGFRMLGHSTLGSEIWSRSLHTRFLF